MEAPGVSCHSEFLIALGCVLETKFYVSGVTEVVEEAEAAVATTTMGADVLAEVAAVEVDSIVSPIVTLTHVPLEDTSTTAGAATGKLKLILSSPKKCGETWIAIVFAGCPRPTWKIILSVDPSLSIRT